MKNSKNYGDEGSAMVTALLVIVVSMIATGSLLAYSVSSTQRVRQMGDSIRAKAIAEAGANRAYNMLRSNYGARHNSPIFSNLSFAEGSYTVIVESVNGGVTRLISVGRFRDAEHRIGLDLRNTNHEESGPEYLDYAIFSNGDMRFNGTPPAVDGDLHTNGDWTLNGSYGNVNGKIAAKNSDSIPAPHRADWQATPFPSLSDPDFQEFLAEAEAAGQLTVYNGNQTFQGSSSFDGITVINGNLTFRGSGSREVNGMLYVTGNVTANGSGTLELNGVLLAGGNVTFNGASGVFSHVSPTGSSSDPDENAHVVVSGWWD